MGDTLILFTWLISMLIVNALVMAAVCLEPCFAEQFVNCQCCTAVHRHSMS